MWKRPQDTILERRKSRDEWKPIHLCAKPAVRKAETHHRFLATPGGDMEGSA